MKKIRSGLGARRSLLLLMIVLGGAAASVALADGGSLGQWPFGGQNIQNTRSQEQKTLGVANASKLAAKWTTQLPGDVSSTPALNNGAVFVTDWGDNFDPASGNATTKGGSLTRLDARTGAVEWQRRIDSYAGEPAHAVSRTSPAVVNGVVYIGDQDGGHVLAIDAKSGALIWNTGPINPGPFTIITQSPLVNNGVVYVGAASAEENVASFPGYPCCSFRGSMSALDAATGQILWTTYMIPAGSGYSGAGVWAGTAALDPKTGTLYIGTGNNYSVPDEVAQCQEDGGTPAACLDPNNHIDAIVALDSKTGAIKWATGVEGFDAWNVGCIIGSGENCPAPAGPDYDFGSGPNLMSVRIGGKTRTVIGEGQKSGAYWLLDATTGEILWGTKVGPGSSLGGIEWGTAAADGRIYVALANLYRIPFTPHGATSTIDYGSYAALDAATGKIIWQTPDPEGDPLDIGGVTVSNGVMFVGSMSGHMYALNAATGDVLWDFEGQGSSNAGPAIGSDGTVYWGNGYQRFFLGAPSHTFYAFSVDGK
jgi:polyvinyl alcohol dehydrogenase (cytochrome)